MTTGYKLFSIDCMRLVLKLRVNVFERKEDDRIEKMTVGPIKLQSANVFPPRNLNIVRNAYIFFATNPLMGIRMVQSHV